jgi:hypothetical protein
MTSVFSDVLCLLTVPLLLGPGTLSVNFRPSLPQDTTLSHQLETVSLCELTQHWEKYDHKVVRTNAIYRTENETSELFDPDCPTSDHTAWVHLRPYGSTSPDPPELQKQLGELLTQSGRARIAVVGRFDGPKHVDIPPDTSPELADLMRYVNSRYGHQNYWKFQFTFSKVEKVEAVPSTEPWPRWVGMNRSQSAPPKINFENTLMGEMLDEDGVRLGFTNFKASDGNAVIVLYQDFGSPATAQAFLEKQLAKAAKVIDRKNKLSPDGAVVGERAEILLRLSPERSIPAVLWTDGVKFHEIYSTSRDSALELELVYRY